MMLTRTAALAALVLVAAAAPAGAYVLADSTGAPGTHASPHAGKAHKDKHDPKHASSKEPGDDSGADHAGDSSADGRAHAQAMKAWAHCVAEAASGPRTGEHAGPPKVACGEKPMPPGLAKHEADGTGPFAAGKGGPGRSDSHSRSSR
jgi:hypothetical protein